MKGRSLAESDKDGTFLDVRLMSKLSEFFLTKYLKINKGIILDSKHLIISTMMIRQRKTKNIEQEAKDKIS